MSFPASFGYSVAEMSRLVTFALAFLLFQSAFAAMPVKNFPLVDQNGKPFQLHDLKGQSVFVSFVFTRCPLPTMCPLTVTRNKELFQKWKQAKSTKPVR